MNGICELSYYERGLVTPKSVLLYWMQTS